MHAFELLCRDEYAAVVRTAWLITGDREESLDLAQEAFARAYERWRTVSAMDRPGGWLQRVTANLAISSRRRRKVAERHALEVGAIAPAPREPDDELDRALASLTRAQRAAVVLRYYADQSVEQTAAALGKRPGTVRALTSQALARLRLTVTPEEIHDEVRN
jgi:RNA polymerase sigma factor (sigma-70 family)